MEETLIQANFGLVLSKDIAKYMLKVSKKVEGAESPEDFLKLSLKHFLDKFVRVRELPKAENSLKVITLIGANGAGKTTLTPKLCKHYVDAQAKPLLAVGDTFRAAAQEQSGVWAQRAGVSVFQGAYRSDPAALAFSACEQAEREGCDVVVLDTAGRLHTSSDLMQQLQKIIRVLGRYNKNFPHETLLVLDATTGVNMMSQLEGYKKFVDVSGVVLTKGDGYSSGGALMSVLNKHSVDILGVSYGEGIDTFGPFSTERFLEGVLRA